MSLIQFLWSPFSEFPFMGRALVGCIALTVSAVPIGLLLVHKRMSLVTDAMSHALLPGIAVAFLLKGFSIMAMSLGAFLAATIFALLAGLVSRVTTQKEDASFAVLYLFALASGVMIISFKGSSSDLMHLLFGNVLMISPSILLLVASASSVSLLLLAWIYRPLLTECVDTHFLSIVKRKPSSFYHLIFLFLVASSLVVSFIALGTLMSVALLLLPALSARFWARHFSHLILLGFGVGIAGSYVGLLISFYATLPTGPSIVLVCVTIYVFSLLLGTQDSIRVKLFQHHAHRVI